LRSLTLPVILVLAGSILLVIGLVQSPIQLGPPVPISIALASPSDTLSPSPTGAVAAATNRPAPTRFATRVVVKSLGIDLPVIAQPGGNADYPLCNVAMYLRALSSPGFVGATYIYAHAREGMFLPLLEASTTENGKSMLGLTVGVYTSDDMYFTYEIVAVHRHVSSLAAALAVTDEELWLQTSEGPHGTVPKLEVVGRPLTRTEVAADVANPTPHPVDCNQS